VVGEVDHFSSLARRSLSGSFGTEAHMNVVAKNAFELPISIGVWAVGYYFFGSVAPGGFSDFLLLGGCQTLAFVCALNACLDARRLGVVGSIFCYAWFAFMAILTPWVLWGIGSIRRFSPM
jgi:hypothetical protein